MVRAQAQCLLSRVGVISPQARVEGGAEGTVDGNRERARMGTEGQMPYGAVKRQMNI